MSVNKLFSEFSIKKIWDMLLKHDKAMNSTILVVPSNKWVEQTDGTYKNTVSYASFKESDKLTVDLYDDGNLSDTQLSEYENYLQEVNIINGALEVITNTKPTQTMTLIVKGDFESTIHDMSDVASEIAVLQNELENNEAEIIQLKSDLEDANASLNTFQGLVNTLNDTVTYIEENLGTLTTEEYTCKGTLSVTADWYGTIQRKVTFDKIFIEPPTIGGYYTYNGDGKFGDIWGTDVTTTSATVNISFNAGYDCSATLVWTAIGLVRKQTS